MSRLILLFALLASGTIGCAAQAHPSSIGGYSVQLVDQWGGAMPTYAHRGSTYVLGAYGSRYGVKVTNHTGQRMEAVVTVDGRDVISGKTGNYRTQRGYIVDAYDTVTVEGFRQSDTSVATFRFTNPSDSYSARMGTPQNVGVIGVAVFKERQHRRPVVKRRARRPQQQWGYRGDVGGAVMEGEAMADSAAPAPSAKGARESRTRGGMARPRSTNNIGTQYGESRHSAVVEVAFKRRSNSPDRVLSAYYDDANGLQARGINLYPHHHGHAHNPQPFPSNEYAPPPPR